MSGIEVEGPDGAIHEFPNGTSTDIIKGVMVKAYGAPTGASAAPAEQSAAYDAMGNATGGVETSAQPSSMPYGEQMANVGNLADNTARMLAKGVPFSDRFTAGAGALTGVGGNFMDYSGNLTRERAKDEEIRKAVPGAAMAGQLVGGALVPLGAANAATKGVSLGGKILRGMLTGAGIGGVQGLSDTEDLTNVPQATKDTATGAALGAAVGGTLPVAASGIGAAYRAVANALPSQADRALSAAGLSGGSRDYLARTLNRDNLAPNEAAAAMRKLGPDAVAADVGDNLKGALETSVLRPSEGRAGAKAALDARFAGQNARLGDDVNGALGPAQNPTSVLAQIEDFKHGVTQPALEKAYSQGQHWTPELDALSQRPAVASSLRKAGDVAANEGRPLPTVILDEAGQQVTPQARQAFDAFSAAARPRVDKALGDLLGEGGALSTAGDIIKKRSAASGPLYEAARAATIPDNAMPVDLLPRLKAAGAFPQAIQKMKIEGKPFDIGKVESWDYMKRALDDRISAATRGGKGDDARIFTGLKNELTTAIDGAVPEYAQARQAYAGHSQMFTALSKGTEAFKGNVTREQLARDFGALATDGERQMFRTGAANAIREKLAKTGDNSDLVGAIAGNQSLRDKLSVLAPDAQALSRFNATLDQHGREFTEATRPDMRGWKYTLDALTEKAKTGDPGAVAARDALQSALSKNPDFARATGKASEYDRLSEAVKTGQGLLDNGKAAMNPNDLAALLANASPAEKEALRIGTRADIDRRMGQNSNDLSALKSGLKGEGDWNRQKLGLLHNDENAGRVFGAMDRESAYNDTRNAAFGNSRTAGRLSAKDDMAASAGQLPVGEGSAGILQSVANLKFGDAAAKIVNKAQGARVENNLNKISSETARILSMPQSEVVPLLDQLSKQQQTRVIRGLLADRFGNTASTSLGILGHGAARERLR